MRRPPLRAQEREPAHDAACLNKFTELLLLNGIIDTEQMWEALSLVANMYHCRGGRPLPSRWRLASNKPRALCPGTCR